MCKSLRRYWIVALYRYYRSISSRIYHHSNKPRALSQCLNRVAPCVPKLEVGGATTRCSVPPPPSFGAVPPMVSSTVSLCFPKCRGGLNVSLWAARQGSPPRKTLSAALSLMEEAQQAGVEVDAATTDAVLTALGKVSVHIGCFVMLLCVASVPVGTIVVGHPQKRYKTVSAQPSWAVVTSQETYNNDVDA